MDPVRAETGKANDKTQARNSLREPKETQNNNQIKLHDSLELPLVPIPPSYS